MDIDKRLGLKEPRRTVPGGGDFDYMANPIAALGRSMGESTVASTDQVKAALRDMFEQLDDKKAAQLSEVAQRLSKASRELQKNQDTEAFRKVMDGCVEEIIRNELLPNDMVAEFIQTVGHLASENFWARSMAAEAHRQERRKSR